MSQDLLIPFIPNINHTRPMSKQELQVNRVTKRPIAKKDEEHRTETEQLETLTYLDALKQQMREAHDETHAQQSLFEEESEGSIPALPANKHGLAKALEQAVDAGEVNEGRDTKSHSSGSAVNNEQVEQSETKPDEKGRGGGLDLFA
ncbi:hypothetical protein ACFSJ3_18965 [Corallincola platygyrae]|uniref:Uncharacterized protein n=1 Tax=Corallincola platygyrae TaxID=1193278 RepID=A0ABW4XUC6_9GAMM